MFMLVFSILSEPHSSHKTRTCLAGQDIDPNSVDPEHSPGGLILNISNRIDGFVKLVSVLDVSPRPLQDSIPEFALVVAICILWNHRVGRGWCLSRKDKQHFPNLLEDLRH